MSYTSGIARPSDPAPLVPQPVSTQIIQELPGSSAVLSLSRRVPMPTKTNRLPVLTVLPTAYFVTGDQGLKQTSNQDWSNITLVAEELAVIVPIPTAYLDDADVPIWSEVRPRIVEAFGAAIDAACIFGTNKPSTWAAAIYPTATTTPLAGVAPGTDMGVSLANTAATLAADGYAVNGFAAQPGYSWKLAGFRNAQGFPIYQPDPTSPVGVGKLYGMQVAEVNSGGWNAANASLIMGDWTKSIIGVRQDITFAMFDQGVIQDDTGAIVVNLMQQDTVALRCVMRLAFQTANPITQLNKGKAANARYPFRVITALS